MNKKSASNQTFWIKTIALINGLASILHLSFWIIILTKLPAIASEASAADRINLATTYGFGIADLLLSVPLLFIGSIGLWKKTEIGWVAALLANVLYWYSFTVVIVRDLSANSLSPGLVLFSPFALISLWATYFLWRNRDLFLRTKVNP